MLISDYLTRDSSEQKKKILIVTDQKNGQALIKRFATESIGQIRNVSCQTLKMILNSVYLYIKADSTCVMSEKILTNSEGAMVFRNVLLKNIDSLVYFTNPDMIDVNTAKEIYDKVNLVRLNGWNGNEDDSISRIKDIKTLIDLYDKSLDSNNQIDSARMYKSVIDEMKKWPDVKNEIKLILGAECSYLDADMENLKGLEKEFLDLVTEDKIELMDDSGKWLEVAGKGSVYKGYGQFNEVSFIANNILENKYRFGDVEVLYSSSAMLPALYTALRGNGIPMSVVSSYPASDNGLIDLSARILAWGINEFSEVYLDRILSAPSIKCMVQRDSNVKSKDGTTESDKKDSYNALSGSQYYSYVSGAANRFGDDSMVIGWSYERNLDFVNHERELIEADDTSKTESLLPLIDMHDRLTHIFGEDEVYSSVSPIVIFDKLVSFIKDYSCRGDDFIMGCAIFENVRDMVAAESRELSLDKAIEFIDEAISSKGFVDGDYSGAVQVRAIGNWSVISRPHVYVTGLSLKDMQGSTTESPVLSDYEMENYLGEGYIPTVSNETDRRDRNLKRTISSFNGESIAFGYSSYDTVGFCENNPSVFLRKVMDKLNITSKNVTEFVYGNPSHNKKGADSIEADGAFDISKILPGSSSSLENNLIKCPHLFAYKKILNIPEVEYAEKDVACWLDPKTKGTFFHAIAENYIRKHLIGNVASSVSRDEIASVANEIKEKILLQIPADSADLADRETEKLINGAYEFLLNLNEDYKSSGYRACAVEFPFCKSSYKVTAFDGTKYEFSFKGFIDRIDYCLNKETKAISLRIGDYKTGKKKSKEEELKYGKLMQYVIYAKALTDNGIYIDEDGNEIPAISKVKSEIARLNNITDIDKWTTTLVCFKYEFPLDETAKERFINIYPSDFESTNIIRLKTILTIIKDKKIYPTPQDIYDSLDEYIAQYSNEPGLSEFRDLITTSGRNGARLCDAETSSCNYCKYRSLCSISS